MNSAIMSSLLRPPAKRTSVPYPDDWVCDQALTPIQATQRWKNYSLTPAPGTVLPSIAASESSDLNSDEEQVFYGRITQPEGPHVSFLLAPDMANPEKKEWESGAKIRRREAKRELVMNSLRKMLGAAAPMTSTALEDDFIEDFRRQVKHHYLVYLNDQTMIETVTCELITMLENLVADDTRSKIVDILRQEEQARLAMLQSAQKNTAENREKTHQQKLEALNWPVDQSGSSTTSTFSDEMNWSRQSSEPQSPEFPDEQN